jgi:alkyl sulfatase BDS1-like metallo-beta-lactamase superfamily hydrolase
LLLIRVVKNNVKAKKKKHHNLEQLGYQEAQAKRTSWLGATRLLIKGPGTLHKSKSQRGHDKNHKQ